MGSYNNPRYHDRDEKLMAYAATFGTSTATAVNSTPAVYLPPFKNKSKLLSVTFIVTTAPNSAATNLKANILNGTNTAAVVTLTTATVGQKLTGTVAEANAVFSASSIPTISVTGTATASGDALGAYSIWFETKEEFAHT